MAALTMMPVAIRQGGLCFHEKNLDIGSNQN